MNSGHSSEQVGRRERPNLVAEIGCPANEKTCGASATGGSAKIPAEEEQAEWVAPSTANRSGWQNLEKNILVFFSGIIRSTISKSGRD